LIIEKEELLTVMPHRSKMFLLSRVTDYNIDGTISSEYDITEQCLFYDSDLGGIPSWVGFEFMAQTVSALSGLRGRDLGIKPRIGFILSVPSMKIYIPVFKNRHAVTVNMKQLDQTDMIYTFEGNVFIQDTKAMEGKIMVMEINEDDERYKAFIEGVKP
jgi:predicted hotdog family 3-hydroxylacyl-ACP dehydratase